MRAKESEQGEDCLRGGQEKKKRKTWRQDDGIFLLGPPSASVLKISHDRGHVLKIRAS